MSTEARFPLDDDLVAEMRRRIAAGEFRDEQDLVEAALRYYFERHSEQAWTEYVEKEIAWSRQHAGR